MLGDYYDDNNVYLYTAHITWFHGGLQFCKGEIGRQHIEGASGCRLSPCVISPHSPRPIHTKTRPQHREPRPYSLRTMSGFFNVPQRVITNNGCETGSTVYRPYPRTGSLFGRAKFSAGQIFLIEMSVTYLGLILE